MKWFYLFLIFFSVQCYAQKIEVSARNSNFLKPEKNSKDFYYIYKEYTIPMQVEIATLSAYTINNKKNNLSRLFYGLWEKANELGANSYRVLKIEGHNDSIQVSIRIARLSEEQLDANYDLYKRNMVYVIGNLVKSKKPRTIKFNRKKIKLAPLEFIAYQNKIGADAILSVGGISGAKIWIKGKKNRKPKFLTFTNYGVGIGMVGAPGIAVNTGRIHTIDRSFGYFLLDILSKKELE